MAKDKDRYRRIEQRLDGEFRFGFLLDPDATEMLIEISQSCEESPLSLVVQAIHTMHKILHKGG